MGGGTWSSSFFRKNGFKIGLGRFPYMGRCKSVSDLCFQYLLLKKTFVTKLRLNFALRPTFFGKNATKFFIEIFSVLFFVDCKVWNLSFQTHSDSSKNIKNSLFYAILKIFCHPWLWPKKGHFGQKPLILGVNRPEKSFLRCSFKTAGTREFSIFFAQNFKSGTSNTMFEIWRRTTRSK